MTPDILAQPGLRGVVRVVGGPGTGKSTMLVQTAAARVASGVDPESILLLTGSSRIGMGARAAITSTVLGGGRTAVREPLVRTVHSYAFAILRLAAQRNGDPPPRLITSAEQDGIIRELLAGDLEDGDDASVAWPPRLRPALNTIGFANELRDLLARCAERGVDPVELQHIGRRAGRSEWVAAGEFAQIYEQVMLLRSAVGMAAPQATVPALGAAELVGAALEAFATDPELLVAERARIRVLLIDDAQHLDPQAAQLVRVLAGGADLTVIAGDPSQAVFGYRGADPALLRGDDERTVVLTKSHRCGQAVARAVSAIAARLPGADGPRVLTGVEGRPGSLAVRIAATSHAECALVADALRRAHLVDGVPWAQMAVIVRSVPRGGAALVRALTAAGVPVEQPAPTTPIGEHPAVAAMLTVFDAAVGGISGDQALALLTGPVGRVDPVSLRQLRRTLRRAGGGAREFGDLVVDALDGESVDLPDQLSRQLGRVRAMVNAARRSVADGEDPRFTLWQAWHHSGLQRRWLNAFERGGPAGVAAGRDLDAVTALFDAVEQYVARTAGATLGGVADHVRGLALPPVGRGDRAAGDAVAVLSAHAALGREWEFVVLAGVQEGLWPNTIPRGGVLATQQLIDDIDGVARRGVSMRAPVLADERRLLVAALARARSHVLVTAVDGEGDDGAIPSAFCDELTVLATESDDACHEVTPVTDSRVLAPAVVVGRLRALVCAPDRGVDDDVRACAATQLARLAEAGVPGADPAQWQATAAPSTGEPLWSGDDHVVTMSPSTLQMLTDCPLRWLLERHGGNDGRDVRSVLGSLVHALVSDRGATEEQMSLVLERVWGQLPFDSQWHAANELERHRAMLSTFVQWRAQTRHELAEAGSEVDVDGLLSPAEGPRVRVRGRVDRLERDAEGRLVVVDLKTGKSPVSKDDAQSHAQLAMYQLAIAEGLVADGVEPGGGRLVYLGKTGAAGATERTQDALTPQACEDWRTSVVEAAAASQGPTFVARINDGCAHCPVRAMCPAQAALGGEA
jgi:superfamily I DNA/RNA helicase/RecB family exonuclease